MLSRSFGLPSTAVHYRRTNRCKDIYIYIYAIRGAWSLDTLLQRNDISKLHGDPNGYCVIVACERSPSGWVNNNNTIGVSNVYALRKIHGGINGFAGAEEKL